VKKFSSGTLGTATTPSAKTIQTIKFFLESEEGNAKFLQMLKRELPSDHYQLLVLVIDGPPGSGKSSFVLSVLYELAIWLSKKHGISLEDVMKTKINAIISKDFGKAVEFLKGLPYEVIFIDDPDQDSRRSSSKKNVKQTKTLYDIRHIEKLEKRRLPGLIIIFWGVQYERLIDIRTNTTRLGRVVKLLSDESGVREKFNKDVGFNEECIRLMNENAELLDFTGNETALANSIYISNRSGVVCHLHLPLTNEIKDSCVQFTNIDKIKKKRDPNEIAVLDLVRRQEKVNFSYTVTGLKGILNKFHEDVEKGDYQEIIWEVARQSTLFEVAFKAEKEEEKEREKLEKIRLKEEKKFLKEEEEEERELLAEMAVDELLNIIKSNKFHFGDLRKILKEKFPKIPLKLYPEILKLIQTEVNMKDIQDHFLMIEEWKNHKRTAECKQCGHRFPKSKDYFHVHRRGKKGPIFKNTCKKCYNSRSKKVENISIIPQKNKRR